MKIKVNALGMCFDWRVLAGLIAVGIAIAVLATTTNAECITTAVAISLSAFDDKEITLRAL